VVNHDLRCGLTAANRKLSYLVDETISRALLSVPGVAEIRRVGGVDREFGRPESARLQAPDYGEAGKRPNSHLQRELTWWTSRGGRQRTKFGRWVPQRRGVEKLSNCPSQRRLCASVSLGDVRNGYEEPRQAALLNGKPVVAFQVLRSTGSTLVTKRVRKAVEQLRKHCQQMSSCNSSLRELTSSANPTTIL